MLTLILFPIEESNLILKLFVILLFKYSFAKLIISLSLFSFSKGINNIIKFFTIF